MNRFLTRSFWACALLVASATFAQAPDVAAQSGIGDALAKHFGTFYTWKSVEATPIAGSQRFTFVATYAIEQEVLVLLGDEATFKSSPLGKAGDYLDMAEVLGPGNFPVVPVVPVGTTGKVTGTATRFATASNAFTFDSPPVGGESIPPSAGPAVKFRAGRYVRFQAADIERVRVAMEERNKHMAEEEKSGPLEMRSGESRDAFADRALQTMARACGRFHDLHGRFPKDIQELREQRFIRSPGILGDRPEIRGDRLVAGKRSLTLARGATNVAISAPAGGGAVSAADKAFASWVASLVISGVRTGANPRVLINRTSYSVGEVVNPELNVTFDGFDSDTRMLRFKSASGTVIERRER